VHSLQFMEFAEVENHDDFYTTEGAYIHTQDQRGVYVMYDVALQDLKDLEKELLLVATQYIETERGLVTCCSELLLAMEMPLSAPLWGKLLDSYFEAYHHALDSEERFALAQVITDIMYKRPRFDFRLGYFVDIYKDECICIRRHLQLIKDVLNKQIDNQRKYNHKIWRDDPKDGISEYGFPPYIIAKQLIAVNNSPPALKNIYLLEFHPSLGLVSLIPKALDHILQEFQQIRRPKTASDVINLEKRVLQLALDEWMAMESPESFYGAQTQKDLFVDVLVEDPSLVREIATSALKSVTEGEQKQGKEKHVFVVNVFSRLLELLTLRHRLIEAAVESARLGILYKEFAAEMGFDEFHLYLRPVYFEFATHKEKADQPPPIFITSLLEDDSGVDRYIPSSLMLSIQDIDNQIGKFSFHTRESILQLLLHSGIENLQIALACQVTQKNTLLVAVQQAAFCHMMHPTQTVDMKASYAKNKWCDSLQDEVNKVKREVIAEYCHKVTNRMSQYSLRSQIIAYYNSIKVLLEDLPSIRDKYFILGLPQEKKEGKEELENDPRSFHPRPRCLLSADGRSFLNLWFIPYPSETLFMFKMLPEKIGYKALRLTLQIVAAFHDIISYIFSFAQLGSAPSCFDYFCLEHLTADWGGTEQIGMELQELQKMIDNLHNPSDPNEVAQMLSLHREVIFLQFDAAVRHSMRKTLLSSGKVSAYQSVTDSIYHGLPPLSNSIVRSAFSSQFPIPQPLDPYGHRLCLCGLNDEDRRVAHGELVGMQFEMEDVLRNNYEVLDDHREWRTSLEKARI
ncbi:UNVERIFIED_CONTAM: hypothetical protein K2H54_069198, partial [Gekko kuhli]